MDQYENENGSPGATGRAASELSSMDRSNRDGSAMSHAYQFDVEKNEYLFVPPGTYRVTFLRSGTCVLFGRQLKLALVFQIVEFGEHFGKTISRWYNVKPIAGRPRKCGRFRVGRRSQFLDDYARIVGLPLRFDRIPLAPFRHLVVIAEVGTVELNHRQVPIHPSLRYSVIRRLVSVEAGSTTA